MKWFNDWKISKKLIFAFTLVALISSLLIGTVAIMNIRNINSKSSEIYNSNLVPLEPMYKCNTDFLSIRINLRDMALSKDSDKSKYVTAINDLYRDMNTNLSLYSSKLSSTEEKNNYALMKDNLDKYSSIKDKVVNFILAGKIDEAMSTMNGDGSTLSKAIDDYITKAFDINTSQAKDVNASNSSAGNMAVILTIVFALASLVLSILIGLFLTKKIAKPLRVITETADKISAGDLDVNLDVNSKDEVGILAQSLQKTITAVKALILDANMLEEAAIEGKLSTRADASKHQGAYKKVVEGVNNTLNSVINPLNVAADYVNRISDGNLPEKITDSYNGDFNVIKNNLNTCIDSINALISDANMLEQAAIEGKLSTRADVDKHKGAYRKIVEGVNNTLDSVINPLNVAADYVNKISDGNLPEKITDSYSGDFNVIKNNLNTCIDSINALVKDANMLEEAATEGILSTRADADKHKGAYKKIVEGVNNTLDAVIIPITESRTVLSNMSINDYTLKMQGSYKGDMKELSDDINSVHSRLQSILKIVKEIAAGDGSSYDMLIKLGKRCDNDEMVPALTEMLANIKNLINEVMAISQGAVSGNLKVRSDASKFKGDYKEVINGLNKTMDAIYNPLNEMEEVIQEMANKNLNITMTGEYLGSYKVVKDSLNNSLNAFNNVLGNITDAADQVSTGSNQVSAGSQALSQGTTEQASSIEELTSSITEVATQTKQNAVNAAQANELALKAKDGAAQGNIHMKEMLKSMDEINESSANISKIIKVIDDIAFQTNILALNAAVEAARAGQHGKGFAVVAEEVRNLAAKSANAAKETTALIEGSIKKVEAGTKIANNTAESLDEIVNGVAKAATLVGEIASASNEQATAISQINKGIQQVSDVVQTNSATAEESAAASEELSGQASLLKNMVGEFNLSRGTSKSYDSINNTNKNIIASAKSEAAATRKKPIISLSDTEFGKY